MTEVLKNIVQTFLFLFIGWILVTVLRALFYINGVEAWIYILIQTINMILWGIIICFIVNRKTLFRKFVSLKKTRKYYNRLAVQFITWIAFLIIIAVNDTKYNFFNIISNYILNLLNLSYDAALFFNVVIMPDTITFLFITVMGIAYLIVKFLLDKSTVAEN